MGVFNKMKKKQELPSPLAIILLLFGVVVVPALITVANMVWFDLKGVDLISSWDIVAGGVATFSFVAFLAYEMIRLFKK